MTLLIDFIWSVAFYILYGPSLFTHLVSCNIFCKYYKNHIKGATYLDNLGECLQQDTHTSVGERVKGRKGKGRKGKGKRKGEGLMVLCAF